jgi:YidC/Oxa1 family membrane protein insertase
MKNNEKEGPIAGTYDWIGITSKYFFIALNNDSIRESDIKIESIENKEKQINYQFEISRMAEKQSEHFIIYAGPTKRDEIKKYNRNYEKILFPVIGWTKIIFWSEIWFPWLADKVLLLLLLIQKCVKDYGIAIIIITIITKIITYPMTLSSLKSMEKMKDIQPKVNKIRQKLKNNPQKMNEEIMTLYKKEGVNPLNPGCLPMFLQMPIFISLFVVLQNAIEIRGTATIILPWIKDLSKQEEIFSIANILPNGIPMYGTNIALLPIIMALLTYFQQKSQIKDPNQKMLIYFMPVFMLVLFNSFPSGLVLYWTFSSAIQLLQQFLINRKKKI